MNPKEASSSYSHPCPACGKLINPSEKPHGANFACPTCGELLKYDYRHTWDIWIISIVGASILTHYLGYKGLLFIPIAICATLVLCALGFFLCGIVDPPGFKRIRSTKPEDRNPFDRKVSLHLTNKSETDKKSNP
jgi:predicted RNA-binding Zn-ribbon protein involved in translation (DUF1610 family)